MIRRDFLRMLGATLTAAVFVPSAITEGAVSSVDVVFRLDRIESMNHPMSFGTLIRGIAVPQAPHEGLPTTQWAFTVSGIDLDIGSFDWETEVRKHIQRHYRQQRIFDLPGLLGS